MAPRPRRRPTTRTERGAAVLWAVATVALCAALMAGVTRVGVASVGHHRAQAVADVVALAAVQGPSAADAVAEANAATLVAVEQVGGATVVVTVELHGARAVAAAAPG